MTITQKPANPKNYWPNRIGSPVNLIVVHTEDGFETGTATWFQNPTSHVSSHYGVGLDGGVDQFVPEYAAAYHSGNLSYNFRSIGIEFEDDREPATVTRTQPQYESGAALIAQICLRYGIPCDRAHIIGHHEVPGNDHPNCPGNLGVDQLVNLALPLCHPPAPVDPVHVPKTGTVKVTAKPWLWLRTGPGTGYPIGNGKDGNGNVIHYIPTGASFEYVDVVHGEAVNGDHDWLKTIRGSYVSAYWTTYHP